MTTDYLHKLIGHPGTNATGIDEIPAHYLEKVAPGLLDDFLMVINNSLITSTFPTLWKLAVIKPVPKVTKPRSVNQFRPISLLCSLSKILETFVYNQLLAYLTSIEALDPLQSGFKKHHSTQTVLIKLLDDVRSGIDRGCVTVLVLFDFSKAFDLVQHEFLLDKLKHLGCSDDVLL